MDAILQEIRAARNTLRLTFILISHSRQGSNPFQAGSTSLSSSCENFSDIILALRATAEPSEEYTTTGMLKIYARKNRGSSRFYTYWFLESGKWICYWRNFYVDKSACLCWKGRKKIIIKIYLKNIKIY